MAILAVSSISSGDFARLFRAPSLGSAGPIGRSPVLPRVEAIPALADREANPSSGSSRKDEAPLRPALDPRRPESLFAARGTADGRPSEGEIKSRLDELQGEKSALERRQADQSGQRSAEVVEMLSRLKARDGEVRAHEAAHMAAGGRYITGGATYSYQKGPDGAEYAVGGEVGIDTSPVPGDPQATAEKMRIVRAAALAPSEPSGADLSVAAAASQTEAEALAEMSQARSQEVAGRYGRSASGAPPRNALDVLA
jgi:hypothetical protein